MNLNKCKEKTTRSLAKTLTYRILILVLDFIAIDLITGRKEVAFGFMLISNVYTSFGYYFHERLWEKVKWGRNVKKK